MISNAFIINKRYIFFIWVLWATHLTHLTEAASTPDLGIECKIFDVGQGNGTAIRDRTTGKTLIVDAGHSPPGKETVDALSGIFSEFVGISRAKPICIVISHPDLDHMNVVTCFLKENSAALSNVSITLYLGGPLTEYLRKQHGKEFLATVLEMISMFRTADFNVFSLSHEVSLDKPTLDSLLKGSITVGSSGSLPRPFFMNVVLPEFIDVSRDLIPVILCGNASHGHTDADLLSMKNLTDIKGVSQDPSEEGNNNSAVVKVSYKKRNLIFTGDIEGKGTHRMLESVPEHHPCLEADILMASHHGSETEDANHPLWVLRTKPQYIIVSAGDTEFLHPRFSTLFTFASVLKFFGRSTSSLHPVSFFDRGGGATGIPVGIAGYFNSVPLPVVLEPIDYRGSPYLRITVQSELPLYSTHSSGTITINIKNDGELGLVPEK